MDGEKILTAIDEQQRWQLRAEHCIAEIHYHEAEIRRLKAHLEILTEQLDYYNALIRDMKKAVKPGKVRDLL